jgi:ParB-like chromosome segregation protein Spo0J
MSGLKKSLEKYGDISGITWNQTTGNLVTGHQRIKALKELYGSKMLKIIDNVIIAPSGEKYPVKIIHVSKNEEIMLNITANNPEIQGYYESEELQFLLNEVKIEPDFIDLKLDNLMIEKIRTDNITIEINDAINTEPDNSQSRDSVQERTAQALETHAKHNARKSRAFISFGNYYYVIDDNEVSARLWKLSDKIMLDKEKIEKVSDVIINAIFNAEKEV